MNHTSTLNYRMFGNGHPVVFLHGFLESISMWDYLDLESLGCQCILIDLPGHGKSELLDDHEPSIQYFATEVALLLSELNIKEYALVGHSMGGYVALQLLENNPDAVNRLVLLNSTYWADSEEKKKDRVLVAELVQKSKSLFLKTAIPNLFLNPKAHESAVNELIEEAMLQKSGVIAYASLAMRSRKDFTQFAMNNSLKITLIQGEEDKIVLKNLVEETNTGNIPVYSLANCGHMAHIEKSAVVIRALSIILQVSSGI